MGCFGSSDPNAELIKQVSVGKSEEQIKVIDNRTFSSYLAFFLYLVSARISTLC